MDWADVSIIKVETNKPFSIQRRNSFNESLSMENIYLLFGSIWLYKRTETFYMQGFLFFFLLRFLVCV